MTRYVSEASPQRQLQEQRAGIESLARRPAPLVEAAGATSFFRAYFIRYSGTPEPLAIAGIGTTNTQARYDWWENSDTSVFEPRKAADAPNPVMSTDMCWSVWLKKAGRYDFTMGMKLNGDIRGYKQEWNDSDTPFGYAETDLGGTGDPYNLTGWYMSSFSVIYPIPTSAGDPPTTYWPDFSTGAHVNGYVTVGSDNISNLNDNELRFAKLEILWTGFTIPPV